MYPAVLSTLVFIRATALTGILVFVQLQLRHPNLLAFKESSETTEKGTTVIYLVTEPVKPLKDVLNELDIEGQHRWVLGAGRVWGTRTPAHSRCTSQLAYLGGHVMQVKHAHSVQVVRTKRYQNVPT